MGDFARWRSQAAELPHTEVAEIVLEESGYTRMWQEDKSPEAPGRLENLKELIGALGEFENFAGFLDHVALVMDTENSEDAEMVSLRSEEHTSEIQSLLRISYAVFCLKK